MLKATPLFLALALSACASAPPRRAKEMTCIALLVYPPNIDTQSSSIYLRLTPPQDRAPEPVRGGSVCSPPPMQPHELGGPRGAP